MIQGLARSTGAQGGEPRPQFTCHPSMAPCSLCISTGLPSRPSAAGALVSPGDWAGFRSQTGEEALRSDQGLLDNKVHSLSTLQASSASRSKQADLLFLSSSLQLLTNSPSLFELIRVILCCCCFFPPNSIWNLKLPNRQKRGVKDRVQLLPPPCKGGHQGPPSPAVGHVAQKPELWAIWLFH